MDMQSKAKKLIEMIQTAPVEWKPLGEIAEVSAGNSAPQNSAFFENGIYPFCRTSDVGRVHHSINFYQIQDKLNDIGIKGLRLFKKETILLPKSGASTLLNHRVMLTIDSYVSSHLATIYRNEKIVLAKYLFYFLSQFDVNELIPDKSYPSLKVTEIAKIKIPIPPLETQKKIVKILDKFTELEATLEATLEAELALRKRQYRYYRDFLLDFDNQIGGGIADGYQCRLKDVVWKTLGEVGTLIRGNGLQKKDFTEDGIPAIHYGQIYTQYGNQITETISFVSPELAEKLRKVDKGDVVITNTSENIEDVGKALLYLGERQAVTGGHATIFKPGKEIIGKFFVHFTQTEIFNKAKRKFAKGTKVIDVSATDMAKIKIPIPPLPEQEKIVAILDKFDTLTHSISEGLPHEIALRRKQYEYYREQLLAFR
ncbi:TPA: restriction endonuclease subunit S [Neisseria meningitidis]